MKAYRYTQPIRTPGAYVDVPMATYHDRPCEGWSVSSSGVRRFLRSPLHYWASSPFNAEAVREEDKPAYLEGRAAHTMVFEADQFSARFAVRPEEFSDYRSKAAQMWRESVVAEGRDPLTPEQHATVQAMARELSRHPEAIALFRDGLPELTWAAKDEATGIWMLARPDFVPASPLRSPCDYKTAIDASPDAWSRDAFSYGYHIQAAMMLDVIEQVTGERRHTAWYVVQEKAAPYAVTTMFWSPEQIAYGRTLLRTALDRMARCIETQTWPGYADEPVEIRTPSWLRYEVEGTR